MVMSASIAKWIVQSHTCPSSSLLRYALSWLYGVSGLNSNESRTVDIYELTNYYARVEAKLTPDTQSRL